MKRLKHAFQDNGSTQQTNNRLRVPTRIHVSVRVCIRAKLWASVHKWLWLNASDVPELTSAGSIPPLGRACIAYGCVDVREWQRQLLNPLYMQLNTRFNSKAFDSGSKLDQYSTSTQVSVCMYVYVCRCCHLAQAGAFCTCRMCRQHRLLTRYLHTASHLRRNLQRQRQANGALCNEPLRMVSHCSLYLTWCSCRAFQLLICVVYLHVYNQNMNICHALFIFHSTYLWFRSFIGLCSYYCWFHGYLSFKLL